MAIQRWNANICHNRQHGSNIHGLWDNAILYHL